MYKKYNRVQFKINSLPLILLLFSKQTKWINLSLLHHISIFDQLVASCFTKTKEILQLYISCLFRFFIFNLFWNLVWVFGLRVVNDAHFVSCRALEVVVYTYYTFQFYVDTSFFKAFSLCCGGEQFAIVYCATRYPPTSITCFIYNQVSVSFGVLTYY